MIKKSIVMFFLILSIANVIKAEENTEELYLSQFAASDYIEVASYNNIPVEANKGDTEGVQNDIGEYLEINSLLKKELPRLFVDRNTDILRGQLQVYADQYKISLGEFMKYYDSSLTEDTYEAYIDDLGMRYSKKLVALQVIAETEELEVTDDELGKYLKEQSAIFGCSDVEMFEKISELDLEECREVLMSQKVLEFLENRVVYESVEKDRRCYDAS